MNNKLTFTGGERNMVEDDFLRIQQSNRLGLHGLTKAFSNDPFIVSGCVVTDNGGNIDVTAGYIFFNGELIQVDAQNAVDTEGNGFYRYEISTTFEAGGDKTYLDSTPRQTWEKKRGVPTSVSVISGGDLDVLLGKRFNVNEGWQTPSYEAGYSGYTTGDFDELQYKIKTNGELQFSGAFELSTPGNVGVLILPAKYWPLSTKSIIAQDTNTPNIIAVMELRPDGALILNNPATTTAIIFLDVSIPLDK